MNKTLNALKNKMQDQDYGFRTINSYQNAIQKLADYYSGKDLAELSSQDLQVFLDVRKKEGFSNRTLSLYINAFNFLYREVVKKEKYVNLHHPKREKKLPIILTSQEIAQLFSVVENIKHKTLLVLAYSAGLGVSEVVNLQVKDLDLVQKNIFIPGDKTKNERHIRLSEKLLPTLEKMLKSKKSANYVFESERGGQLTVRSAQKIFENALAKSQINKKVSFYSLRHSFAYFLIQRGTDLPTVQEILGHKNIRTSRTYLQLLKQKK